MTAENTHVTVSTDVRDGALPGQTYARNRFSMSHTLKKAGDRISTLHITLL